MLYEGAFVAERYTAVGELCRQADRERRRRPRPHRRRHHHPRPGHPGPPALRRPGPAGRPARPRALAELADADALLLPTAPGHPTLAEVAADPLGANARLGRFTNSTNLFDLAAVAVPAGEVDGLPFGVMLIGPAFTDERLARIARAAPARRPGSPWSAPT